MQRHAQTVVPKERCGASREKKVTLVPCFSVNSAVTLNRTNLESSRRGLCVIKTPGFSLLGLPEVSLTASVGPLKGTSIHEGRSVARVGQIDVASADVC